MTPKQKQWARIGILLLLLIAAVIWKGQGFLSEWDGTVTQVVLPEQGSIGYATVRDVEGRYFRVNLPREQIEQLDVGDHLAKQRFSLVVKLLEKAARETTAPVIAP